MLHWRLYDLDPELKDSSLTRSVRKATDVTSQLLTDDLADIKA